MKKYQVALIHRPDKWKPECDDDVPLEIRGPIEVLTTSDNLFAAVDCAIEYNLSDKSRQQGRWAAVVEPGGTGHHWPAARLCTPLNHTVVAVFWPDGWEPLNPLDVPNCVHQAQEHCEGDWFEYAQAEAAVLCLNRQCMDRPGETWYVVTAVENEPVSQTVCRDKDGVETATEVRPMHIIRPSRGGRGDCSHCPAGEFPCAEADWTSLAQTISTRRCRPVGTGGKS